MLLRRASLALLLTACAAPAPLAAPQAPRPRVAEVDICVGSPPVPHALHGVLRAARCDQDAYAIMASVGEQLGVTCKHCHVPIPNERDKEDYVAPHPRKDVANWMSGHLMAAVKPADGSPLRCRSCHTDEQGRPVAKILGDKRDPARANEWMSVVLTRKFVAADGSKLRCRSCHAGTPGTAAFDPKVIGKGERLPKHEAGGQGTPSF
jgi:hypothetical protein